MKTYKDWENSLDDSYSSQFSPDAWEFTQDAFNAGQQSRQAEIDELQKRVDQALNLTYLEKRQCGVRRIR